MGLPISPQVVVQAAGGKKLLLASPALGALRAV